MLDLFGQIAKKWTTSPAEILGRQESDIDTLRFLGVELELTEHPGQVVMHQHPYLVDMLERYCPDLKMRSRGNPGEPDSFQEAQKQALEVHPEQKPLEGNLLAIVGSLLWASLRTRPDSAWAVSRAAALATKDLARCRVRLRHIMQYLLHTLMYCVLFEPVGDA
eukprot:3014948-Amphidinium_carterae.1